MRTKINVSLMFMLVCLLVAGCVSQSQKKADFKTIGEQVCSAHGGLSIVDPIDESAVYTCKDGMTLKVATKPFVQPESMVERSQLSE